MVITRSHFPKTEERSGRPPCLLSPMSERSRRRPCLPSARSSDGRHGGLLLRSEIECAFENSFLRQHFIQIHQQRTQRGPRCVLHRIERLRPRRLAHRAELQRRRRIRRELRP